MIISVFFIAANLFPSDFTFENKNPKTCNKNIFTHNFSPFYLQKRGTAGKPRGSGKGWTDRKVLP